VGEVVASLGDGAHRSQGPQDPGRLSCGYLLLRVPPRGPGRKAPSAGGRRPGCAGNPGRGDAWTTA
jgi:hypothetical protein